jgi:hypothetical protein
MEKVWLSFRNLGQEIRDNSLLSLSMICGRTGCGNVPTPVAAVATGKRLRRYRAMVPTHSLPHLMFATGETLQATQTRQP